MVMTQAHGSGGGVGLRGGWGGLELVDEGLPFFVEDEQQEVGDQQ